MSVLFEKLYECGSGAGMKPIGFYLDGLSLTVGGKQVGMSYTPEAHLKLTSKTSGEKGTGENMETGSDINRD
jgi:hypothetical protein